MKQEMMFVVKQTEIAHQIYELTLTGELVNHMNMPGQFIHIRVPQSDLLLRRPISLASISKEKQTCTIIYRVDGDGTSALKDLVSGDTLDVLGPLGNGFKTDFIEEEDIVLIIGGGIGVPPLYELGKRLTKKKAKLVFIQGFATKSAIFYEREFSEIGEVVIATDDGSYGKKGHVGNLIEAILNKYPHPKAIYACGPTGLLHTVKTQFKEHPHVYLSMEERMACGIGACYACVCQSANNPNDNKKVCDEGPVFNAREVIV